MTEQYEKSLEPPLRGGDKRRPPDPYAVGFAEECRKNPGVWIKFTPRSQNFQAQHRATTFRDQIYRGIAPWGDDRWEATTRKVRGNWDPKLLAYRPEWEVWVSYQGVRQPGDPEPEPAETDDDQPRIFERY